MPHDSKYFQNWTSAFRISFIFSISFTVIACSSVPTVVRAPNSEDNSGYNLARDTFYINLIPEKLRAENVLGLSEFKALPDSCGSTLYGPWLKNSDDAKTMDQKNNFLLEKINRPFNFYIKQSNDSQLHIIGRLADFKEFICLNLALSGGDFAENKTSPISNDFISSVLNQPNINFQVLQLMLSAWVKDSTDTAIATKIVNHSLFSMYDAHDLLTSMTGKKLSPLERINTLKALLKTSVYKKNSLLLSSTIFRQIVNISSSERLAIAKLVAFSGDKTDREGVLNFALSDTVQGEDYRSLYEILSANQNPILQAKMFLSVLYSDASFSNPDQTMIDLSKNSLDLEIKTQITNFMLNYDGAVKRLSPSTVINFISNLGNTQQSDKTIQSVLSIASNVQINDAQMRLNLFTQMCRQAATAPSTAFSFLGVARGFILAQPNFEASVTPCAFKFGKQFKDNSDVFSYYDQYWLHITDSTFKMVIAEDLLASNFVDEYLLLSVAQAAIKIQNEKSYQLLEEVLSRKDVTVKVLEQVSSMMLVRMTKLSDSDKKIIALIDSNPLATDKIKSRDQVLLGGPLQWINIEDVPSH